jgi:hypothetical protein
MQSIHPVSAITAQLNKQSLVLIRPMKTIGTGQRDQASRGLGMAETSAPPVEGIKPAKGHV